MSNTQNTKINLKSLKTDDLIAEIARRTNLKPKTEAEVLKEYLEHQLGLASKSKEFKNIQAEYANPKLAPFIFKCNDTTFQVGYSIEGESFYTNWDKSGITSTNPIINTLFKMGDFEAEDVIDSLPKKEFKELIQAKNKHEKEIDKYIQSFGKRIEILGQKFSLPKEYIESLVEDFYGY